MPPRDMASAGLAAAGSAVAGGGGGACTSLAGTVTIWLVSVWGLAAGLARGAGAAAETVGGDGATERTLAALTAAGCAGAGRVAGGGVLAAISLGAAAWAGAGGTGSAFAGGFGGGTAFALFVVASPAALALAGIEAAIGAGAGLALGAAAFAVPAFEVPALTAAGAVFLVAPCGRSDVPDVFMANLVCLKPRQPSQSAIVAPEAPAPDGGMQTAGMPERGAQGLCPLQRRRTLHPC
jgi:hypothetical protein